MLTLNRIVPFVLLFSCSTLYAQTPTDRSSQWQFRVGTGMLINSQLWKGIDTEVTIMPFAEASFSNWFFNVDTPVAYKMALNSWLRMYVGISNRSGGYEHSDFVVNGASESKVFKGYKAPESETVIKYGLSLGWVSVDASTDISKASESSTASLSVEVPVYQGKAGLMVSSVVTGQWMDANYVNHYYGIAGEQVDQSQGRSSYQVRSATNYEISIKAKYLFSEHWLIASELSHTLLADEIAASPLVDSHHQETFSLLAIYQF